jgi:galactonate dehydratase
MVTGATLVLPGFAVGSSRRCGVANGTAGRSEAVRVVSLDTIECDFGWRSIGFVKIATDEGVVGWSEFSEAFGSPGLRSVLTALRPYVVGADALNIEGLTFSLNAMMRPARGGVNRQAVAAIENALLDIKGKALGMPVSQLLGGALRDRIPVYWSHCGTYRTKRWARYVGVPALETYDDVVALGGSVRDRGFLGLKTNVLALNDQLLATRKRTYVRDASSDRLTDSRMIREIENVLSAFRAGAGDELDIYFDANFNFDTEGYLRVERAVRPFRLAWLELDIHDPDSLALIRRSGETPIGSGEAIYERIGYRPFFEAQSFDIAIVDVLWNGYLESLKIASMADAFSVPVAPHNFYGHLATMISAHFAAAVPNLHVMETDIDGVPWRDEITTPPSFDNGYLLVPAGPGWGVEVNEAEIRAHPVTEIARSPWR